MITNTTRTTSFSMDDLRLAKDKMEAFHAEHLRRSAEINAQIEQMTCIVCGRHPTFIRNEHTEILEVCRHTWEVLKRISNPTGPACPLTGLRIKLFDDEP